MEEVEGEVVASHMADIVADIGHSIGAVAQPPVLAGLVPDMPAQELLLCLLVRARR